MSAKLRLELIGDQTTTIDPHAVDAFSMASLGLSTEWPLNVVIDESALAVYNQIFRFLVKIRRVGSALQDIRRNLFQRRGLQQREAQLCHRATIMRQEMQYFTSGLLQYIMHQVSLRYSVHSVLNLPRE